MRRAILSDFIIANIFREVLRLAYKNFRMPRQAVDEDDEDEKEASSLEPLPANLSDIEDEGVVIPRPLDESVAVKDRFDTRPFMLLVYCKSFNVGVIDYLGKGICQVRFQQFVTISGPSFTMGVRVVGDPAFGAGGGEVRLVPSPSKPQIFFMVANLGSTIDVADYFRGHQNWEFFIAPNSAQSWAFFFAPSPALPKITIKAPRPEFDVVLDATTDEVESRKQMMKFDLLMDPNPFNCYIFRQTTEKLWEVVVFRARTASGESAGEYVSMHYIRYSFWDYGEKGVTTDPKYISFEGKKFDPYDLIPYVELPWIKAIYANIAGAMVNGSVPYTGESRDVVEKLFRVKMKIDPSEMRFAKIKYNDKYVKWDFDIRTMLTENPISDEELQAARLNAFAAAWHASQYPDPGANVTPLEDLFRSIIGNDYKVNPTTGPIDGVPVTEGRTRNSRETSTLPVLDANLWGVESSDDYDKEYFYKYINTKFDIKKYKFDGGGRVLDETEDVELSPPIPAEVFPYDMGRIDIRRVWEYHWRRKWRWSFCG